MSGNWQLSNGTVTFSVSNGKATTTLSGQLEGTVLTVDGTETYGDSESVATGTIILSKQ